MSFVHLYLQTEYSMLQSSCSIEKTFKLASTYNATHLSIVDEGNMYGVIKFYKEAIKFIIKF